MVNVGCKKNEDLRLVEYLIKIICSMLELCLNLVEILCKLVISFKTIFTDTHSDSCQ